MLKIEIIQSGDSSDRLDAYLDEVLDHAETVALDLGSELQQKTPVAFGATQAGWDVESRGDRYRWGVTVSNAVEYAYYAIAGRGPGAAPPAGPGSPLDRWARLKGLARGAAFGVARKVARVGTDRWQSRQNALDVDPVTQELRDGSPVRQAQERLRQLIRRS